MSELLPCPFCGEKVSMTELDDEDDRRIWTRYIECEVCDLKMRDYAVWPKGTMLFTREDLSVQVGKTLTNMWNTRAGSQAKNKESSE